MSNIITFLGPRLQEGGPIGGYTDAPPIQVEIKAYLKKILTETPNVVVFSSLSPGIEWWAVEQARVLKIPYTIVIPFDDYESKWPQKVQKSFNVLCDGALSVEQIGDGPFSVDKMRAKDKKLLTADIIHSFYQDNTKEIDAAIQAGKTVIRYFPALVNAFAGKYNIPKDTQTWEIEF